MNNFFSLGTSGYLDHNYFEYYFSFSDFQDCTFSTYKEVLKGIRSNDFGALEPVNSKFLIAFLFLCISTFAIDDFDAYIQIIDYMTNLNYIDNENKYYYILTRLIGERPPLAPRPAVRTHQTRHCFRRRRHVDPRPHGAPLRARRWRRQPPGALRRLQKRRALGEHRAAAKERIALACPPCLRWRGSATLE